MRPVSWIVGVPVAAVAVAFAIANRGRVTVSLDPLPVVIETPVYALALSAFLAGLCLGAAVTWVAGRKWRRLARRGRRRVAELERELASAPDRAGPPRPDSRIEVTPARAT